jgi:hypothetical protein
MSQLASEHTTSLITEERSNLREKNSWQVSGAKEGPFFRAKVLRERRVHFEIVQAR